MAEKPLRLAVISDVHGNLPALEAVLADIDAHGVDAIASAGDLVSGTDAEAAVAQVGARARWTIAGNHERYYAPYPGAPSAEILRPGQQWAPQRWCYDRLSAATREALSRLPEQTEIRMDGADPIRLVHGAPSGIADHLYPDRDPAALTHFRRAFLLPDEVPALGEIIAAVPEPVVICGHTHIPWAQREGDRLAVNVGSVGSPINGDARAQYAILTWEGGRWRAQHRAVPYDVARVRQSYEASGYLAEGGAFALALLRTIETGLAWTVALLRHIYAHARAVGWEDVGALPDEIWDEGVASFDWQTYPEPETSAQLS
jgi:predicted phosphodiesterase